MDFSIEVLKKRYEYLHGKPYTEELVLISIAIFKSCYLPPSPTFEDVERVIKEMENKLFSL